MYWLKYEKNNLDSIKNAKWILLYSTIPHINKDIIQELNDNFPETIIFGTTSSKGVFTPDGFRDGCFLLVGEPEDHINVFPVLKSCDESRAFEMAREASMELINNFGRIPDQILIHATPGFEELIIDGIESVFNSKVPVHGGSSANDRLSMKDWFVFSKNKISNRGFIVVGITNESKTYSSFVSGYLPKGSQGLITSADGRKVFEIDHRPAAEVYNEWTDGILDGLLESGGQIIGNTILKPLGKIISSGKKDMHLIAHPHFVNAEDKSLLFFCDFKNGDKVTIMHGSTQNLLKNIGEFVSDSNIKDKKNLKGGIFIYCAGCMGVSSENGDKASAIFAGNTNNIPFLGIASYGEQGSFKTDDKNLNMHGNLMSCAILF